MRKKEKAGEKDKEDVSEKGVGVGRRGVAQQDCIALDIKFLASDRLVGLVVKASASRAENPACDGIFRGRVIPVT